VTAKRPARRLAAKAAPPGQVSYVCPICDGTFAALHRHHIVPQAAQRMSLKAEHGEGPTLDLCAACHNGLHSQALAILAGSSKQCFTPKQYAKAKRYVGIIVAATQRDKDALHSKSSAQAQQVKKIMLTLTQEQIQALDVYKLDNSYSSRDAAVRAILAQALGLR
jgi:hypothetical protein